MLLKVKIAELQSHLEYVWSTCDNLQKTVHPNLAERLQQLLKAELSQHKRKVKKLAKKIGAYEKAPSAAMDTWRQIYSELIELAEFIHYLRTNEIPAYLASSPDDHFFSSVLEEIHREVGLDSIKPVATLYQGGWFAAAPVLPNIPLYFLPSSIASDPSELPLIYHEIGHILFRLWGAEFWQRLEVVFKATVQRKILEARLESDPAIRESRYNFLTAHTVKMSEEMEELVCDIVGVLLGGEAFVAALNIGLFCLSNTNPFDADDVRYPPLDCRMRIGKIALKHLNVEASLADYLASNWANVQSLHAPPFLYRWVYDDQYLSDITIATKDFLIDKNLKSYSKNCGGIRQELNIGLEYMINDPTKHQEWVHSQNTWLTSTYSSSKSSS